MTISARRLACVSDIRELVDTQRERVLETTLDIGAKLIELQEQCTRDTRLWTSLFPDSDAEPPKSCAADPSRQIALVPGSRMLRYVCGSPAADLVHTNQDNLKL